MPNEPEDFNTTNLLPVVHATAEGLMPAVDVLNTPPASTTSLPTWMQQLLQSDSIDTATAVALLFRQSDSGVQGYLCKLLRRCPSWEVEYYLPQLCHLIIIRPTTSLSLQAFIVELCTHSMHSAVCVLWFLDAYVEDLRDDTSNPAFALCLQLYRRCQAILFSNDHRTPLPESLRSSSTPTSGLDGGLSSSSTSSVTSEINISTTMATPYFRSLSSPVLPVPMPGLSQPQAPAPVSIRRHVVKGYAPSVALGIGVIMAAIGMPHLIAALGDVILNHARSTEFLDEGTSDADANFRRFVTPITQPISNGVPIPTRPLTLQEMHGGRAFSFSQFVRMSAGESTATMSPVDLPQRLLNPHYFYSELQFIMTLVDIGDRLVSVAKEAREATLQAELNLLSHNLPARVCVPLWCPATREHPVHHHVVRISPQEAVILNSKARVPYLIHVEVLESSDHLSTLSPLDYADLSSGADDASDMMQSLHHESSDLSQSTRQRDSSSSRGPLSDMLIHHPDEKTVDSRSIYGDDIPSPVLVPSSPQEADLVPELAADSVPSEQELDNTRRMRTASVMLAQLSLQESTSGFTLETSEIRNRIIRELKGVQGARLLLKRRTFDDNDELTEIKRSEEDPSAYLLQEDFDLKTQRIRKSSPFGQHPSWRLLSVIVKCRDDLRQEQLACQIIAEFKRIWTTAGLPLFVYPFRVLVTSRNSGLVETIPNAVSIHSIKKNAYTTKLPYSGSEYTLSDHFAHEFGPVDSPRYATAQNRFAASLAGYSLVCYFLQIKDRHDGNILLDREGRLIHIDYGFMLSNSPGGVGFETAPFKLSQEYLDVLSGRHSDVFDAFHMMFFQGFLALRKHADNLTLLIEIMQNSSKLPCFGKSGEGAAAAFRDRFQLQLPEASLVDFVDNLIVSASNNVYTSLYDQYQYYTNGIL